MNPPTYQVSRQRRLLYHGGFALTLLGVLLFLSTFLTAFTSFGNFDGFDGRAASIGVRALGGIVLVLCGRLAMRIGTAGWAGSGRVLDPPRVRQDLELRSRMAGGVVGDALPELKRDRAGETTPPEVKVRCRSCQALNDEGAKFCNQCGATL